MLTRYALLLTLCFTAATVTAERIYVMPGTGFNQCDPELVTAIQSLGHTVDVAPNNATSLPVGFTTTCVDPVNGYDWLCFFGVENRVALLPDLQIYLDLGGKIYLQWEVDCCTASALSSASIANALTGQPIIENPASYIALGGNPAWEANSVEGCLQVAGNAYRCMDGVPVANQLLATATLNGGSLDHTTCPVFGFVFSPGDLPNGSGGIIGFGDVNLWYQNAGEPPNNLGTQPVDMAVVSLVFPTPTSGCSLLPVGCLSGSNGLRDRNTPLIGTVYPNPANEQLTIELQAANVERIDILDAMGRLVKSERSGATARITVDIGQLAPGAYQVLAIGSSVRERTSFVVAR
ncbi:MAG: T9SS type A sorting domain-containing protein [Flavobacteriales bacterium]|nr:T9SS type A sorting domain-containing protein [Flavobacteriales bacterium]